MQTFYEWLEKQVNRKDLVGDFAYTMRQFEEPESRSKKAQEHVKWATWLADHNATWELINAFNISWRAYQRHIEAVE